MTESTKQPGVVYSDEIGYRPGQNPNLSTYGWTAADWAGEAESIIQEQCVVAHTDGPETHPRNPADVYVGTVRAGFQLVDVWRDKRGTYDSADWFDRP